MRGQNTPAGLFTAKTFREEVDAFFTEYQSSCYFGLRARESQSYIKMLWWSSLQYFAELNAFNRAFLIAGSRHAYAHAHLGLLEEHEKKAIRKLFLRFNKHHELHALVAV